MNNVFSNKYFQVLTVTVLAVILFVTVLSGWNAGKSQAEADIIAYNAQQFQKAMNYFYNDQDRYPTADEFADTNVLGQYVHPLPLPSFASSVCAQTFNYKHPESSQYQLQFCLPRGSGNFGKGWNQISDQK